VVEVPGDPLDAAPRRGVLGTDEPRAPAVGRDSQQVLGNGGGRAARALFSWRVGGAVHDGLGRPCSPRGATRKGSSSPPPRATGRSARPRRCANALRWQWPAILVSIVCTANYALISTTITAYLTTFLVETNGIAESQA
jgi:hypothetical protein